MRGLVLRRIEGPNAGVIAGEDGLRYSFSEGAADSPEVLVEGCLVEFEPGEGLEALDVHLTVAPDPLATRGGALDQAPPESVSGDKVMEASWASFPASDPPGYTGVF